MRPAHRELEPTSEETPHRSAGAAKKEFVLEYRWVHEPSWMREPRGWRTWRRYKTEAARDEALRVMQRKEQGRARFGPLFEYRVPPSP